MQMWAGGMGAIEVVSERPGLTLQQHHRGPAGVCLRMEGGGVLGPVAAGWKLQGGKHLGVACVPEVARTETEAQQVVRDPAGPLGLRLHPDEDLEAGAQICDDSLQGGEQEGSAGGRQRLHLVSPALLFPMKHF